jgi:hypothetical protein
LCYYNGLYLANKLNKHEYFSAKYCPNLDMSLVEEFSSLDADEYIELIKSLNASMGKKYWLAGWLNRTYVGKYLGNLIYARPSYIPNVFNIIKSLINDNNYMVRNVGIWILRLTLEFEVKPPNDILHKSMYLINDWYFGNRVEYALYFHTLLEKFPDILNDITVKKKLISTLILKHAVDRNRFVREVCVKLLSAHNDLMKEYPGIEQFKNYHTMSISDKIRLLEMFWKIPELRKTVAILVKVEFRTSVKNGDCKTMELLLSIFEKNICCEIGHVLPELIKLKEKFKSNIAKKIIDEYREKYPMLSDDLESIMMHTINETIIFIRTKGLSELLLFVREGFLISNSLLDGVKEIAIYECVSNKNINLALSILKEINDIESKSIVSEKTELIEYLEKPLDLSKIEKENLSNLDWKECSIKISYIPTIGEIKLFTDNNIEEAIDAFVDILSNSDKIILKIMVVDLFIEEVAKNDEFLIKLLDNKNLFAILFELCSAEMYPLLSKKSRTLFEKLALKGENWLRGNLINYIKNSGKTGQTAHEIAMKIIKLMMHNMSVYVKMELINSLEYAFNNNILHCDKEMAHALSNVLSNIGNDQPWMLFKKTTDLIFSEGCMDGEDKELLEKVLGKFVSYGESSEDKKHYISLYLKKLLESNKYNFTEIDNNIFEKLIKFENNEL